MSMTQPNGRGGVHSITIVIFKQLLDDTAEADFVSPRVVTQVKRLSHHGIALYFMGEPTKGIALEGRPFFLLRTLE